MLDWLCGCHRNLNLQRARRAVGKLEIDKKGRLAVLNLADNGRGAWLGQWQLLWLKRSSDLHAKPKRYRPVFSNHVLVHRGRKHRRGKDPLAHPSSGQVKMSGVYRTEN